jgi:predicted cation transporter
MDMIINLGLLLIFCAVLFLPFFMKKVEYNLEIFLFVCGAAALTIAGFASIPGATTGWSWTIIAEALTTPLDIARVGGVPIGIVQVVLIIGFLIYYFHHQLEQAINNIVDKLSIMVIVPALIIVLGFISSIISAILAAIILIEIINSLPLIKEVKIEITVVACFAIGLGAGLTPLGEPLSTIVVSKLSGEPYHADFWFLFHKIGLYIIPAILLLGVVGLVILRRWHSGREKLECIVEREAIGEVVVRAGKVYLFIMALVFLGEGFKPLILEFIVRIPPEALYWANMVSAVLDNATLAAAEIGPALSNSQITGALVALLISGGMLIPGNIPNIIAAGKMKISSREWARVGVPLGIALMVVFFGILFIPGWLGIAVPV